MVWFSDCGVDAAGSENDLIRGDVRKDREPTDRPAYYLPARTESATFVGRKEIQTRIGWLSGHALDVSLMGYH